MTQTASPKKIENSKTNTLARIVAARIEELLCELNVRLFRSGNKLIGCCPIHGGDNSGAINLYPEGDTVPGFWLCRSHHCENIFKPTIIGFVRGVLSHQKYGWEKPGDKTVSFQETIEWLEKFVGQKLDEIKVDEAEMERRRFASQISKLTGNGQKKEGVSRHLVQQSLEIPAQFFLERGYSPAILSAYDVGLCNKQGKEMCGRVVVPVYDKSHMMIGCTGRSIFKQCDICRSYHDPATDCPSDKDRWLYSKWKNSKNFLTGSCLYNYWKALKHIQDTGVVVLVEGPPDLWRLVECGVPNVVALFGCELSDEQQVLLESSGAMSMIVLLDNDEAGKIGTENIRKMLYRFYDIYTPELRTHDVGEMTCENIRSDIIPIIKEVQKKRGG